MLYPTELLTHITIFIWFSFFVGRSTFRLGGGRSIRLSYWRMDMCIIREKRLAVKGGSVRKKRKMPLYRWDFFRYNKLICYGYHTFLMEILI